MRGEMERELFKTFYRDPPVYLDLLVKSNLFRDELLGT